MRSRATHPRSVQSQIPLELHARSAAPLVTLAFAAITPLLLIASSTSAPLNYFPPAAVVTVAVIAWSSVQLSLWSSRPWDLLPIGMFYLYCYVWLGVAPLIQILDQHGPLPYTLTQDDYLGGSLIVLVGIAAFEAGRRLTTVVARPRPVPHVAPNSLVMSHPLAAAAVAIVLASALVAYLGGPAVLWTSRQQLTEAAFGSASDKSTGAIITAALTVPPYVLLVVLLRLGPGRSARGPYRLALGILLVLNVIINNPITQGRFWFVTVWGTLGLIWALKRPSLLPSIPVVFLAGTLLVFPNADIFRYASSASRSFQVLAPEYQLTNKGDFDSFQQIALGFHYVSRSGFEYGHQLLGSALFFIPRSIWADKPIDTGSLLANYANFANANLSAPLWLEGYIDGGLVLVVVYLLLVGSLLASAVLRNNRGPALAPLLIGFYQLVILRGSLLQSMSVTTVLLLTYLLATKLGHHPASRPEVMSGERV